MTYNMSFTEGSTITGLFTGVNTASSGLFGGVLLLGIFIVAMISVRSDDFKVKMFTSSFLTFIIAGVMFVMTWIPQLYLVITIFVMLISGFILIWGRE